MVRKSNTLELLTPDVLSRLNTPGERRDFPFKYSIGKERRSVNGSRRPFMTRVTLDADDDEAQLSLVKRFRDYYFGPKDIVEASVVSDFKEAVAQRRRAELDQRSAPPRPRTSIPAGRRVPTSWMKSHRRKKMSSMAPKGMKPTKVSSVPGRKHLPKKPHTWKDYVWTHMHNWHFAGTGPGVQAKYVLFFFSFFLFPPCLRFFYSHFFPFFPHFFSSFLNSSFSSGTSTRRCTVHPRNRIVFVSVFFVMLRPSPPFAWTCVPSIACFDVLPNVPLLVPRQETRRTSL